MGTLVTNVRTEGNTIRAGLHGAPRVASSYGPGFGGYHFRPRYIQVAMQACHLGRCDGRWHPRTVTVRGRWPVGFLTIVRWDLDRKRLPVWLAQVVADLTRDWKPTS